MNEGKLEKLEITAYTDENFTDRARAKPVMIPINPEEYSRSFVIAYNDTKAAGSAGGSPVFDRVDREEISFVFYFDGTGVVPRPPGVVPISSQGIMPQIQAFQAVTCAYDGGIHGPCFLKLVWGVLVFKCRLKSLTLNYTLFTPNGIPLRAKADAKFLAYTDERELRARTKPSSPDLTHVLTVEAGDTLPLMCDRVYGRGDYYTQVAHANGLTGFRDLRPGMQLVFPPLAGHA